MVKINLFTTILLVVFVNTANAEEVNNCESAKQADQLADSNSIGIKFRHAIDAKYEELSEKNLVTYNGPIGAEIPDKNLTPVALKYIPIGTSLGKAKAILKYAGFSTDLPALANYKTKPNNLVAFIMPYGKVFNGELSVSIDYQNQEGCYKISMVYVYVNIGSL